MNSEKITVTKENIQYDINKDDKWFGRAMGAFSSVAAIMGTIINYPIIDNNIVEIASDLGLQDTDFIGAVASLSLTGILLIGSVSILPSTVSKIAKNYHAYSNNRAYVNTPK